MMILFTTDFSSNATHAFSHALWWANQLKAEINVLHVYQRIKLHSWIENSLDKESLDQKIASGEFNLFQSEIDELKKRAKKSYPEINLTFTLRETERTVDGILAAIEEIKPSMVVMGTKGETGLVGFIFGSVTSEIAQSSPVPVLGIPPEAETKEVKTIGFPFDFENGELSILEKSLAITRKLNATLDCVHVSTDPYEKYVESFRKFQEGFAEEPNIDFSLVETEDAEQGLMAFQEAHNWDVIVWHQHEDKSAFGFKNVRKTALEIEIPFLTMNAK